MKDSVARFSVEAVIKECDLMIKINRSNVILPIISHLLKSGLVSDDTNNSQVTNKSDTIEIDRAVAERWIQYVFSNTVSDHIRLMSAREDLTRAIQVALSGG